MCLHYVWKWLSQVDPGDVYVDNYDDNYDDNDDGDVDVDVDDHDDNDGNGDSDGDVGNDGVVIITSAPWGRWLDSHQAEGKCLQGISPVFTSSNQIHNLQNNQEW